MTKPEDLEAATQQIFDYNQQIGLLIVSRGCTSKQLFV
jgi:hypothetical protein